MLSNTPQENNPQQVKQQYNRPKVGLAVIVVKDGMVLIGKRLHKDHGYGCWQLSGGHLEKFETLEDCAKREVKEETGVEIKNIRFITATNNIVPSHDSHYVCIVMQADYADGEPVALEPEKATDWHWCKWEEIPTPRFHALTKIIESGYHPLATVYQKLVRDKIPEIIQKHGSIAITHEADINEYKQALQAKLIEELSEYLESESVDELADIMEIINAITTLHGIHREQFKLIQKQKRDDRGGFEKRIILEETR